MRTGTAAAAHQRDIAGVTQQLRQLLQLLLGGNHHRLRGAIPVAAGAFRCRLQGNIAGQHHDGDATVEDRFTHGNRQHLRDLFRVGDQLAVVAAFTEKLLWMRLLKIAAADFARRNMRGDGKHRHAVALAVKQAVDQVQVARPAGACAHRKFARYLRFGACGKSGHLFMAGGHPVDGAHAVQAVAQPVEGVAGDAPNPFYARLFEGFGDIRGHCLFHIEAPFCDHAYKLRQSTGNEAGILYP